MLLTKPQILEILLKEETTTEEILNLIQTMIYEKKGYDVVKIIPPTNQTGMMLFSRAREVCFNYFDFKYLRNE